MRGQGLGYFLDRLLPEVRDRSELSVGLGHQVTDRLDTNTLQAVVAAYAELELLDREVLHTPCLGKLSFLLDEGFRQTFDRVDIGEDRELPDQDLGCLPERRPLDRATRRW